MYNDYVFIKVLKPRSRPVHRSKLWVQTDGIAVNI